MKKLLALGLVLALSACIAPAHADPPLMPRAESARMEKHFDIPAPSLAAESAVISEYEPAPAVAVLKPLGLKLEPMEKGSGAVFAPTAFKRPARVVYM